MPPIGMDGDDGIDGGVFEVTRNGINNPVSQAFLVFDIKVKIVQLRELLMLSIGAKPLIEHEFNGLVVSADDEVLAKEVLFPMLDS